MAEDVFIYLTRNPAATRRRIVRFYHSLKAQVQDIDFHIVTYDAKANADTKELSLFDRISMLHTTYNARSLYSLSYPNRPNKDFTTLTRLGYADLPVLLFWRDHRNYRNFWVMEDDVEYTGQLGLLVKQIMERNGGVGLACTHLRKLPLHWEYIDIFSSGSDTLPRDMVKRVCFLPFFCVSNEALSAIDSAYARGWTGYNEMTWPMILDFSGVRIRDIGGNGPYTASHDWGTRYIDRSADNFSKLGSFGTMHIRLFRGRERDVLWHPVKRPGAFVKMRTKRVISIYRWYKLRLTSGARTTCRRITSFLERTR